MSGTGRRKRMVIVAVAAVLALVAVVVVLVVTTDGDDAVNPPGSSEDTIDPRVQQAAQEAMTRYTGVVVALKPQTGEILAMVSTPSEPAVNRAIQRTYPPGMTFALVVAAAALENGMTADTQLPAAASIQLPGTRTELMNANGSHCGPADQAAVSMATALQLSCNTAFATLADQVGKEKLAQQARKFGIGQTDLKIPVGVVASGIGSLPDRAALYTTGIGQRDARFTPLQGAMVAAAIANNGTVMRPRLVRSESDELGRAMSSGNTAALRDMMTKSEANTRGDGKIPGLVIASKTGTAEAGRGSNPASTPPHGWYIAFAPVDNPQIAVAVLVDSGGDRGLAATASSVAASVGRATIKAGVGD